MKRRLAALATLVLAAAPLPAVAHQVGQKYEFAREDVPSLRVALGLDNPAVQSAYERLYGAPLEALTLYYAGERVGAIEAQFAPEDFDRVVQASMREHGEAQPEQPAHAVSGNAVYTWRAGSRVLRVERFFAPTGRASLIITDQSFLTELVER